MEHPSYLTTVYNRINTDFPNVALCKILKHGTSLDRQGRRNILRLVPSWSLFFSLCPIQDIRRILQRMNKMFSAQATLDFHSKTGRATKELFNYVKSFKDDDIEQTFDFIVDYIAYIRGVIEKFPTPPAKVVDRNLTKQFKLYTDTDPYLQYLKTNWTTLDSTQDVVLFFKLSFIEVAEIMCLPLSNAVHLLEIYRIEQQKEIL